MSELPDTGSSDYVALQYAGLLMEPEMTEAKFTALELLQRNAMQFNGAIITQSEETSVHFLEEQTRLQLQQLLSERIDSLRREFDSLILSLEPRLSCFLQTAALRPCLQHAMTVLRGALSGLRLHDVRTEVLMSWLDQSSNSSSVVADGASGASVAADPRNDATPDTSAKGVNGDA